MGAQLEPPGLGEAVDDRHPQAGRPSATSAAEVPAEASSPMAPAAAATGSSTTAQAAATRALEEHPSAVIIGIQR